MDIAKMLERDEGRVKHAYLDSEGLWTIGVGTMIDQRDGGGLRDHEIDYILASRIKEAEDGVRKALSWFDRLDAARQGVLVSMAFQMGVAGLLEFKLTLGHIRDEHWPQAAGEMLASTWAKQTPGRARMLARQIETGEWQ
jgi:lysozyme